MSGGKIRVKTCAVAICPSPQDISYHVFPKDAALQRLWLQACMRKDFVNVKTARICGNHFEDDDYERDLRNEMLKLPTRKILKPGVVPSKNLFPKPLLQSVQTTEQEVKRRRIQKEQPAHRRQARRDSTSDDQAEEAHSPGDDILLPTTIIMVHKDSQTSLADLTSETGLKSYIRKLEETISQQAVTIQDLRDKLNSEHA